MGSRYDLVNQGIIKNISKKFSKEESLELFEKMSKIRHFELNVAKAHNDGAKMPVFYLCAGQEATPAALSIALKDKDPAIFGQHRAHGYYIAFGGDLEELVDELLGRSTGCAQGMGGSASIHSPKIGMYGHDGLMGSNIPISVGYALAKNFEKGIEAKSNVLAIAGDAAMEEDYAQASIAWSTKQKLPILFVCEDNNYSVMTEVDVRRDWKMADVAQAYGVDSVDITDDPWLIMHHANRLKEDMPAFMNIYGCRLLSHAFGKEGEKFEWDRFYLTKEEMERIGLGYEAREIEDQAEAYMGELWKKKLEE